MKKRILRIVGGLSLTVLTLAVFSQVWVRVQADGGRGLVGSWDVTVTPRDCATGNPAPFPPRFSAVQTYNLGGTMLAANQDASGLPLTRVGGQGVWARSWGREYSTAWRVLNVNPDGSLAGKDVIRDVIHLGWGGDTYTSTGTLEIYNPAGILVFTACATTSATRFQ
ncbi:MAG: hypothetical protein AB7F88_17410 [Pyrinomonadaceae bacterium]